MFTLYEKASRAANQVLERSHIVLLASLDSLDECMEGLVDGRGGSEANQAVAWNRCKAVHVLFLQKMPKSSSFSAVEFLSSYLRMSCQLCLVLGMEDVGVEANVGLIAELFVDVVQNMERVVEMIASEIS